MAVWLILYRDTKRDGTARASLDDLARRGGMNRQTASQRSADWLAATCFECYAAGGLTAALTPNTSCLSEVVSTRLQAMRH